MTTSIGGLFTSPPEIVSWGPSEINLFAFAVGTDQALWYAQLDGFTVAGNNAWSGWQSLGGVVMSRPRAVRSGELSVDVCCRRTQRTVALAVPQWGLDQLADSWHRWWGGHNGITRRAPNAASELGVVGRHPHFTPARSYVW
jgi:hypothetical protein